MIFLKIAWPYLLAALLGAAAGAGVEHLIGARQLADEKAARGRRAAACRRPDCNLAGRARRRTTRDRCPRRSRLAGGCSRRTTHEGANRP